MSRKRTLEITRKGMTGKSKAYGSLVTGTLGGTDQIPEDVDVKVSEVAMEDEAMAVGSRVHASMNRDLHIQGAGNQGEIVDGTAEKGDFHFDHTNAAALLVAGAGTSSEVFKKDTDRMEELLKGESVGISEDKIFKVKQRPTVKKPTKVSIQKEIEDVKDVLEETDNGHFIFYYSGHFTKKKGFQVDTKDKPEVDFYTDKDLADELMKIPAKYILLILDMCHSATAELGAKDGGDGLAESGDAEDEDVPDLWDFFTKSIDAKSPGGNGGTAEKVVQWSSSGREISYTHKPTQTSFFTSAIIDIITDPEAGKEIRKEMNPGQTHVSVLHLHKHVTEHVQNALSVHSAVQTPIIKPPYADENYFKMYPYFAKIV